MSRTRRTEGHHSRATEQNPALSASSGMILSRSGRFVSDIDSARAELRLAYRSASVGQIYSGVVWLASAGAWLAISTEVAVWVLLIGGFLIYPVTVLVTRLLGSSASVPSGNPLREAAVTIPIVGALGIPVAGAAALYEINWFYPAFMVIMGAHYLPFSHLYGMRLFIPVGAGMWFVGLAIALWFPDWSAGGAVLTGLLLIAVGLWASSAHTSEFGSNRPAV